MDHRSSGRRSRPYDRRRESSVDELIRWIDTVIVVARALRPARDHVAFDNSDSNDGHIEFAFTQVEFLRGSISPAITACSRLTLCSALRIPPLRTIEIRILLASHGRPCYVAITILSP